MARFCNHEGAPPVKGHGFGYSRSRKGTGDLVKRRGSRTRGPFLFLPLFGLGLPLEAHEEVDPQRSAEPLQGRQQDDERGDSSQQEGLGLVKEAGEGDPPEGAEGVQGHQDGDPEGDRQGIIDISCTEIEPRLAQEGRCTMAALRRHGVDRLQPIWIAHGVQPSFPACRTTVAQDARNE